MTDTPMIPADVAAARVAAAYKAAAQKATSFLVGDPANGVPLRNPMAHEISVAILAAADPDGSAALARLLAEVRAEGMREAGALVPGAVHEWLRTKASLGVKMQMGYVVNDMIADVRAAILAAADKEAAK